VARLTLSIYDSLLWWISFFTRIRHFCVWWEISSEKKQKTKKRNHCDGWHLDVVQWLFTKTSHTSYIFSIGLGKFESTNPVWTIFIWNCNQIQTLWDCSSNGCWMWTLCQYAYSISLEISTECCSAISDLWQAFCILLTCKINQARLKSKTHNLIKFLLQ